MRMGRGVGRVGRRGLVGTMARTAVVAGTATAVVGGVSHTSRGNSSRRLTLRLGSSNSNRQRWSRRRPTRLRPSKRRRPGSGTGRGTGGRRRIAQLQELAKLKEQGILSDEEFAAEKARILGG